MKKLHVCGVFDETDLRELVNTRKNWRRCPLDDDIKDAIEDYIYGDEDDGDDEEEHEDGDEEKQGDEETGGDLKKQPARRASLTRTESR